MTTNFLLLPKVRVVQSRQVATHSNFARWATKECNMQYSKANYPRLGNMTKESSWSELPLTETTAAGFYSWSWEPGRQMNEAPANIP